MKPEELIHGEIGSNQYLAYRIRSALNPIEIFGISTYSAEEIQWATEQFAKAYNDYDLGFLRDQLDGLRKLSLSDPTTSRDPRFFFVQAYMFLYRTKKKSLPTLTETIELTKRIWAITRKKHTIPELPLPRYDRGFEQLIRREIDLLPRQKWERIHRPFGFKFSKAKPGPKPKSKASPKPKRNN
jgi:hypothetical protein